MRKVNSEPQGGWDAKTFSDERNLKGNKPIQFSFKLNAIQFVQKITQSPYAY